MAVQNPTLQRPKKPYSPPRLTCYGDVRALTQGGPVSNTLELIVTPRGRGARL